jgi:aldehyde dehydrogenase (NAD+)
LQFGEVGHGVRAGAAPGSLPQALAARLARNGSLVPLGALRGRAEAVGLPPGVLNVVTADREVSELLVRDPRVDKITFTGSTAAGRRIASLCGERIARCTLELGGKSAAVILDDIDIETTARTLAQAECFLSGQVCSSLTRIVVPRARHAPSRPAAAARPASTAAGTSSPPCSATSTTTR